MVTTAGGIEEDLMKCLSPHFIGDFALKYGSSRRRCAQSGGALLLLTGVLFPQRSGPQAEGPQSHR